MRRVEILAPAGSYESAAAAVYAGCDAIYIGGSRFGARAYADNPDEEQLLEVIRLAHLHGKKVYLTVNTLLKEEELKDLYDYLIPYYMQGLDAVIVQDVGVIKWIHELFPLLPIHASTQMTLTGSRGANLLTSMGVTRFVPARELGLEEIRQIRRETSLEIETFVHGALCYCYSGQCLLSSMIGGRSGNRGRCAQPCRMPYQPDKGEASYLLSTKDICTIKIIPELMEAGIDSFKIEGRMKRPEYTALCAYTYGKYVDLYESLGRAGYEAWLEENKNQMEEDIQNLMDLYNRGGFTTGYYKCSRGKEMMSMKRPNHHGVKVGLVKAVNGDQARILLEKPVGAQDVLEFRDRDENALYDYTLGTPGVSGQEITARIKKNTRIKKGSLVYRTKNAGLIKRIGAYCQEKKIPVTGYFEGRLEEPMKLVLTSGEARIEAEGAKVLPAKSRPLDREQVGDILAKTGDSCFAFEKLEGTFTEGGFLPVGKVKELRREAFLKLEEAITGRWKRQKPLDGVRETAQESGRDLAGAGQAYTVPLLAASVCTPSQWEAVSGYEEIRAVYLPPEVFTAKQRQKILSSGKKIYYSLPYISRYNIFDTFSSYIMEGADGFLVRNYEEAEFLIENGMAEKIITDSNLYTFNRQARQFWKEKGIKKMTAPVELNKKELKIRGGKGDTLLVYGRLPLMISAQCITDQTGGCTGQRRYLPVRDRKNKELLALNMCCGSRSNRSPSCNRKCCYTILYDSTPLSLLSEREAVMGLGFSELRLDFTTENKEETCMVTEAFIRGYRNKETEEFGNCQKGHFRRGIL